MEMGQRGRNFYPRPPGGGRQIPDVQSAFHVIFLSTPSGWRATPSAFLLPPDTHISIHALRVEGDRLGTLT